MDILEKNRRRKHITLSGRLDAYSANHLERKLDLLIDAAQVRLVLSLEKLEHK